MTEYENGLVVLAVESGMVTKARAAKVLRIRVDDMGAIRESAIRVATLVVAELEANERRSHKASPQRKPQQEEETKTAHGKKTVTKAAGGTITRHVMV